MNISFPSLHRPRWVTSLRQKYRRIRRPKTVTLNGIRLPVDRSFSPAMQTALYSGSYETAEHAILHERLAPADRVVEFGTGLGYMTTFCALRCGSDSVATYEANIEMESHIRATFRLNRVSPRLSMNAVAKTSRPVEFFRNANFWSSSRTRRSSADTPTVSLAVAFSDVVSELQPTFLLMDIEGGEVDLIHETIQPSVRKVLIELHEHVVGQHATELVRRWLLAEGFQLIHDRGNRSVIYCERPPGNQYRPTLTPPQC